MERSKNHSRQKRRTVILLLTLIVASSHALRAQDGQGTWSNFTEGQDISGGVVLALAFDVDGNLFAGGNFERAGNTPANRIAVWNGSNWTPLANGLDGAHEFYLPRINALVATPDGTIYAGGFFHTVDGQNVTSLAKWNGFEWTGVGLEGWSRLPEVHVMVSDGADGIFLGGLIERADDKELHNIAHWDGQKWHSLGTGVESAVVGDPETSQIHSLAVDVDGNLYAGGDFTEAGGEPANHVAMWDGEAWHPLGSGLEKPGVPNISVTALAHDGTYLYAAGGFTIAGGQPAQYVARWDGNDWESMGDGLCGYAYALEVIAGDVYAGGNLDCIGGQPLSNIARWDGESWTGLGPGVSGTVLAMEVRDHKLYVAGGEFKDGDYTPTHIAVWDPAGGTHTENLDETAEPAASITHYPNPFRQQVQIVVDVARPTRLELSVATLDGREVALLADSDVGMGNHQYSWEHRVFMVPESTC